MFGQTLGKRYYSISIGLVKLEPQMFDSLGEITGILAMVLVVFLVIAFIALLAPVLGLIGGGFYEALFIVLALVVVVAGVIGYSRR
jgi:hypothetical protein